MQRHKSLAVGGMTILITGLMAVTASGPASAAPVAAATARAMGYSYDSTAAADRSDWMQTLPETARLSTLSIPGTHDSASDGPGGWAAQTQTMSIGEQLKSGVRYLDTRVAYDGGSLELYHGVVKLDQSLDHLLSTVSSFLTAHPDQFVLMRLSQEHSTASPSQMEQAITHALAPLGSQVWDSGNGSEQDPDVSQIRGKIVILDDAGVTKHGVLYKALNREDTYNFTANWDLYSRWELKKARLGTLAKGSVSPLIPFTSIVGSGGSFPYFVASGKSSPGTNDPQLLTGMTTPGWSSSAPDFPRVACFIGICSIAFLGLDQLTAQYIAGNSMASTGIIAADFPGHGLIDAIIQKNPNAIKITRSASATNVSVSLNQSMTDSGPRILAFVNGKYAGEIYKGGAYYSSLNKTNRVATWTFPAASNAQIVIATDAYTPGVPPTFNAATVLASATL